MDAWERAVTTKTRVIVINYPSNPTGVYPSADYLKKLQDFAAANQLWVVSDEVYENLYYGQHPTCAASIPGARERTVLVHSLSKTYAMTGWRVGYLAAPAHVIENALKAGQNSITCVAPFIQRAAAFALTDAGIQQDVALMRAGYARRRELVLRISAEHESDKVLVTPPMGAFYFFLDMRALGLSSSDMCERILEEAGVGLIPGAAFGHQGEGFARMTTAASDADVEAGFRKILAWAEKQ
jgi:aspartate/methionine/tyrosine aminotransferase